MFCDLFRRLEGFSPIGLYRYVGFGSVCFSDFQLFHRILGIADMVSIEKEVDHEQRFRFNKPFDCIDLKMGCASEVLPTLDWQKPTIVWLDYDKPLRAEHLADISTVVAKCLSGSLLMVTVNVGDDERTGIPGTDEADLRRLTEFTSRVGESNVPLGLTGSMLRGDDRALVYRHYWLFSGASQHDVWLLAHKGRSRLAADSP